MAIDRVGSNFDNLQGFGEHAFPAAMCGPDNMPTRHFHSRRKDPRCQVPGCKVDLASQPKLYCLCKRICMQHMQADALRFPGNQWFRFCFQCAKVEPLACFDGSRRSCRQALHKRKTRPLHRLTDSCLQHNMHWQQPHNLELQQHVHNLEHSRQGLLVGSSVEQQLAAASQTLAAAQKVAEQTSQAIAALHGGARGMQCLWHPAREAALANPQGLCCPGLLPAGTEALQTDQPPKTFDKQPDQSDSDDGFGSFLSSLLSPDGDNSHSSDIMPSAGMSLHTSGESAAWNIAPPANPQLLQVPVLPPSTCNSSPAVTSRTQLPEMATSTVGTIVTGQTSTGPVLGTQLHQNGNLLRSSQVLGPSIGLGLHVDTAIACAHVQPAQQQGGNIWPLVSHDSTVPTSGISSSGMYGACALDLRVPLPGAEEQLRALGATLQQLSHVVNSLVERTRVR